LKGGGLPKEDRGEEGGGLPKDTGEEGGGARKKQTWSSPVPSPVLCDAGPAGRRRNGSVPSSGT
jgi:hypothetical protein